MTAENRKQMIEEQARAFRMITLLILLGEADKDPATFAAKVKSVCQKAAERGA